MYTATSLMLKSRSRVEFKRGSETISSHIVRSDVIYLSPTPHVAENTKCR